MRRPHQVVRPRWWPWTEIEYWIFIVGIEVMAKKHNNKDITEIDQLIWNLLPLEIRKLGVNGGLKDLQDILICELCHKFNISHPIQNHPTNSHKKNTTPWKTWSGKINRLLILELHQPICFIGHAT